MTVLNTNINSTIAVNAVNRFDRSQGVAMERLSTGLRINQSLDDAAGLAVSERMRAQVSGYEQAGRNVNDAISLVETVEGATVEIHNMLQRMRELAVQAATGTLLPSDRAALDLEFGQLFNGIEDIALNTTWNTFTVMNGGNDLRTAAATPTSFTVQVGKNQGQSMAMTFSTLDPRVTIEQARVQQVVNSSTGAQITAAVAGTGVNDNDAGAAGVAGSTAYGTAVLYAGTGTAGTADDVRIDITSASNAGYALTQLDTAITALSADRARYAAYTSRLETAFDSHTNIAQHQAQSRSVIADADYGVETSALAKQIVLQQAGTAMLAQANQSRDHMLSLLE
ncbi:flagellin [Gammaproteobacteria bacterium]|jgi:flagellin|nr:flagellin [Gammaproteobacteria bacterium]MDB2443590.1 flagellin [Gammaproteobacteria bacterium]